MTWGEGLVYILHLLRNLSQQDKFRSDLEDVKQEIEELYNQLDALTSADSNEENDAKEDNEKYCFTRECISASNNLFQMMNLEADPCDNFNEFACGKFIKESRIPDDKKRWTVSEPLEDLSMQILNCQYSIKY